jgi:hypothetical protein
MANYMSLYGAVKINGKLTLPADPPRIDASIEKIVYVIPAQVYDTYGTLTPCFQVVLEDDKSLTEDTAYLYQIDGMTTIAQFLAALVALPTEVPFTQYNTLLTIDYKEYLSDDQPVNVLINDRYVVDERVYNPSQDTTAVYVWCVNWLKKRIFTFDENQTTAGAYEYFG